MLDWDKLRIFHATADAGSFTRAGEALGLSQSAVSRQIAALEGALKVPLFHRHARGLILTEQGELLFQTARDVAGKLEATRARLGDSREHPSGDLKVTTTVGLGSLWLLPRLEEFIDLYPDVRVDMILTEEELDLSMREADVAIRLRQPVQPDLIQRKLFTIHFHVYASSAYLKRRAAPRTLEELDDHRILTMSGTTAPYILDIHTLHRLGRNGREPRPVTLSVNNIIALKRAAEAGYGVAILPDYLVEKDSALVQVLPDEEMPTLDTYLVYPHEMRNVARVQIFREFLIAKAQRWAY